jgi:hypothetical protein
MNRALTFRIACFASLAAACGGSGRNSAGAAGTSESGATGSGATTSASGQGTGAGSGSGGSSSARGTGTGVTTASAGSSSTGGTGTGTGTGTATGTNPPGDGGPPASNAIIQNDVFWKDTSGNPIYSQGGGVLQVGDVYYWYGVHYAGAETYAAKPTGENGNTTFVAVTIYSSTDLANWKFEGNALTAASVGAAVAFDSGTWIGRVGAAYNSTTKKYVLNGQYLGSPDTEQFFATSDTPNGAFAWAGTQATITNVTNGNCGDQSIFNDDDGTAYLVCSSLNGRSNIYVAPLRPADYLEVEPATRIFGGAGREGNVMFKANGRYYACSSDLHGWNASHTYYISATSITGPYSAEGIIGNTDLDFSHVTQTGLFFTVKGTAQNTVVFGGDRWSDFAGNGIGYNQWVPLTFDGTAPVMQSMSQWSIDAATGAFSAAPGNNYVLNPSFEADRVATNPPEGWTTTGGADGSGGHSGNFAWQLSGTSSVNQTIASVPNGTYTLSAWVKSSAAGGQLFATGFGGSDMTKSLAAATSWTQVSIAGIVVSNGQCQVGASTSGQSVTVDDFVLSQN